MILFVYHFLKANWKLLFFIFFNMQYMYMYIDTSKC